MYIIVAWSNAEDAIVLADEDGDNRAFLLKENARVYAYENCARYWKVIEV